MKPHLKILSDNNLHTLFCLLSIGFVFSFSCRAKNEVGKIEDVRSVLDNQIAFITYGTDPDAEKWYEYNDKGDLTRQVMSVDTIVFEYADHQIVKRHLNKKNSWQSRIVYTTDQNGRISQSRCYDENDKEISQNKFMYNAQGYIIKNIEVVLASGSINTNEYMYEDGNLIEVKSFLSSGLFSSRYVYEYFSDKPDNLNLFMQQISDDIFPNQRLGKKNKNMVRQFSNIDATGDTLSLLKYTYPEQDKKDMLTQKQSDVLNEFEAVITYHFNSHIK